MTTAESMRNDLAKFLVEEHSKEKQIPNEYYNHSNIDDYGKIENTYTETNHSVGTYIAIGFTKLITFVFYLFKKLLQFIYLYIKTLIILTLKFIWNMTKYIASLYRPTVNFVDNYFTKTLKFTLELISHLTYNASIRLYKYGKSKKYYKVKVGEKKYSEMDLARMASGIGDYENLTLKDIQDRFTIGYDTAIKVRDMRNDTLKMLQILKETLEKEKNNY